MGHDEVLEQPVLLEALPSQGTGFHVSGKGVRELKPESVVGLMSQQVHSPKQTWKKI